MTARIFILIVATLALIGCRDRGVADFVIPIDHPAHPDAPAAPPIVATASLEAEFEDVKPELDRPASRPPSGHHH